MEEPPVAAESGGSSSSQDNQRRRRSQEVQAVGKLWTFEELSRCWAAPHASAPGHWPQDLVPCLLPRPSWLLPGWGQAYRREADGSTSTRRRLFVPPAVSELSPIDVYSKKSDVEKALKRKLSPVDEKGEPLEEEPPCWPEWLPRDWRVSLCRAEDVAALGTCYVSPEGLLAAHKQEVLAAVPAARRRGSLGKPRRGGRGGGDSEDEPSVKRLRSEAAIGQGLEEACGGEEQSQPSTSASSGYKRLRRVLSDPSAPLVVGPPDVQPQQALHATEQPQEVLPELLPPEPGGLAAGASAPGAPAAPSNNNNHNSSSDNNSKARRGSRGGGRAAAAAAAGTGTGRGRARGRAAGAKSSAAHDALPGSSLCDNGEGDGIMASVAETGHEAPSHGQNQEQVALMDSALEAQVALADTALAASRGRGRGRGRGRARGEGRGRGRKAAVVKEAAAEEPRPGRSSSSAAAAPSSSSSVALPLAERRRPQSLRPADLGFNLAAFGWEQGPAPLSSCITQPEDQAWVRSHPLYIKIHERGYPLPFGDREILALRAFTPREFGGEADLDTSSNSKHDNNGDTNNMPTHLLQ
eukprot:CAMPEP_0115078624 /NCGR_PEP_ID=MMETSP0227-20121206/17653_1 /TAXON_ID=89957 /ORGANISM="Polarella glacialis, Strain CCMP 1383" /LENGTH=579 /DNA_ID=CAMNT_0002466031 /DNA_START=54 /DNA_END=1794 /DNA_ORIENTATION=+